MKAMKKIVVASDSFKGSATSMQIARAAAEGIRCVLPECEVAEVPVGDGGEATAAALVAATSGRWVECRVQGPLHASVDTRYGVLPDGTAVIELASAAGLPLVSPGQRNPLLTTSRGVGDMMAHAIAGGCTHLLMCIGGSATNDAGIGLLAALGYRFLDSSGREVAPVGGSLANIMSIDDSGVRPEVKDCRIDVACDVSNPFCGPDGAACVFAPQKGADAAMVRELDDGLRHFAGVIRRFTGTDVSGLPGAGAAGGAGGALKAFLGARLRLGIEMVLDAVGFDDILDGADLVITGEGHIDAQTLMGKTPYGVLCRARRLDIPVIAIGGSVSDTDKLNDAGFTAVMPILPSPVTLSEAMDTDFTLSNVRRTITQLIRAITLK